MGQQVLLRSAYSVVGFLKMANFCQFRICIKEKWDGGGKDNVVCYFDIEKVLIINFVPDFC